MLLQVGEGSLSRGLCPGGFCLRGLCLGGSLSEGSLSVGGLCHGDPPYGNEQAVRILLECILVDKCFSHRTENNRYIVWVRLIIKHTAVNYTGSRL